MRSTSISLRLKDPTSTMRTSPRRLAIVPARGGSKGLPGKNIAEVGGESLLARAVRCALESRRFDLVIVSTDDEAIAAEGRRSGAEVPFLRSPDLASDTASVLDAVRDALARLAAGGETPFSLVALLEPTSPLRTPDIVARTVEAAERDGFDAAFTVSAAPTRFHPLKQFGLAADGAAAHVAPAGASVVNRQELEPTYVRNGMCYAVRTSALDAGHGVLGAHPYAIVVEGPIVNIDDAEDLALARKLIDGAAPKV